MARGGITKALVQQARASLQRKGINPSIDAVRAELGNTGSKTTIHRYMKELEEAEGARLDDEALLSRSIRETIGRLAGQLQSEARAIVDHARAEHERALHERDQVIESLKAQMVELEAGNTRLAEQLKAEQVAHGEASQALATMRTTNAEFTRINEGLQDRLAEKEDRITSLEDKHRNAREALEHYRNSVATQRAEDLRVRDSQVQGLHAEIRTMRETVSVRQEEATRLNSANAELVAKLGSSEKETRELKAHLHEATEALRTITAEHGKLGALVDQRTAELENARASAEELTVLLAETREALDQKALEEAKLVAQLSARDEIFNELKGRLAVQPST